MSPLNGKDKWETLTIDGIDMVFMDASGTEAASEMATYIPSMKALWTGELTYHGMHCIYTLRGAKSVTPSNGQGYQCIADTLWR